MTSEFFDEFKVQGSELQEKIKSLIHEGNVRRIIIMDNEGNTYMEIPLAIGVAGVILAPLLAAIGALATVASDFKIKVIRKEEEDKS